MTKPNTHFFFLTKDFEIFNKPRIKKYFSYINLFYSKLELISIPDLLNKIALYLATYVKCCIVILVIFMLH